MKTSSATKTIADEINAHFQGLLSAGKSILITGEEDSHHFCQAKMDGEDVFITYAETRTSKIKSGPYGAGISGRVARRLLTAIQGGRDSFLTRDEDEEPFRVTIHDQKTGGTTPSANTWSHAEAREPRWLGLMEYLEEHFVIDGEWWLKALGSTITTTKQSGDSTLIRLPGYLYVDKKDGQIYIENYDTDESFELIKTLELLDPPLFIDRSLLEGWPPHESRERTMRAVELYRDHIAPSYDASDYVTDDEDEGDDDEVGVPEDSK